MTPELPRNGWRHRILPLAILALVLIVSLIVRIRLLDAPLERDEGEHAYMAQALLEGYAPWQIAYNLKLPGTDMVYALVMGIFGQTAMAIRLGLLLVNIATTLLVALLGRRLFGFAGGAVAGAAYGLLSCSQGVLGTIAHSTHYVLFFAVIATLLLLKERRSLAGIFLTGLIYGVAFLMKQPGLAFGLFGFLYLAWRRTGVRPIASYILGLALPYALLCLALWRAGTFPRFWFWTVTLARAYAASTPFWVARMHFARAFPQAIDSNIVLWALAGAGLALGCWNSGTRRASLFTGVLLLFSFLSVSAGGAFNNHYFVLMLPAVALGAGAWIPAGDRFIAAMLPDRGAKRFSADIAILCFALACAYSVLFQRAYLFRMSPYEFERSSYGLNPFPEAVKVAEYIQAHSGPGTPIAVLGSEAEIYFYARRPAATGYLFTYGLMETHQYAEPAQKEMIHEIEAARPQYIVFVGIGASWLPGPDSSRGIFRWANSYTAQYYDVVGAVDLRPGEPTQYVWGPDASVYNAASPAYMTVYRRR